MIPHHYMGGCMYSRRQHCAILVLFVLFILTAITVSAEETVFRIGMIGLDTSHVINFTKIINDPARHTGCRVIAGYPGGSSDVESSYSRIEGYTAQLRDDYGVTIVDNIEELCGLVDGVMLESVDGRPHLEQARPVIEAGLPLFIDKPMAGSLADVIAIFDLAREHGVPCWCSSSLRFNPGIADMLSDPDVGEILGCVAFSPAHLEEHHPDLYWYGIHGVETLFTLMGTGCESVSRAHTDGTDIVTGVWRDGRIGTFRGIRDGKKDYGALVFGAKSIKRSGGYTGSEGLADRIVAFFLKGTVPVAERETIEIYAFMSAADLSKERNGAMVTLKEVIDKAKMEAPTR